MKISLLLDMAAEGFPDRTVLGGREDGYTVRDLQRMAAGGAAFLRQRDATALVYLDVNGPSFAIALFAAACAGVPLIPLNFRAGAAQLRELLGRHPGAIGLASDTARPLFEPSRVVDAAQWVTLCSENAALASAAATETDQPAAIIYTSGTTAAPKGVVVRHRNLAGYVFSTLEFGAAGPEEASLVSVPPYHIAAVANVCTNLYSGRRSLVLSQFSGSEWLGTVRREGISHALVVPTMLARILEAPGERDVPSLRVLSYGGASMPPRVIETALAEWPQVDFVNAYGLTETSSTIAVLGPDEHRSAFASADPRVRARLGSAGRPVPGVNIEIRDGDGRPAAPGVTGRIFVRGDQVSGEYAETGPQLDAEGFFDTRDDGFFDDEGYLFVAGRSDDTIIRGAENIAPTEIEATLLQHESVADAVVVGVPDAQWGQRLEAVVVAADGREIDAEALREFVRSRLRSAKTPDRVLVWTSLPRTETGKLVRRDVLARLQQAPR